MRLLLALTLFGFLPLPLAAQVKCIEPDAATGFSRAMVVDDVPLVHTPQFCAKQTSEALASLEAALKEAQSGLDQIVRLHVYVARQEAVAEVEQILAQAFRKREHKPAVTLAVCRLPEPDAVVALDAVATTSLDPGRAVKLVGGARSAIVPKGTRIYIAGQAEKGKDLAEATRLTLESLEKTLKFLGQNKTRVVQLKAFLTPMTNVEAVRQEMTAFFGKDAPPIVYVEWTSGLPIEIELIAWGGQDQAGDAVEYLTPPGMTASPIYSRVARTNHTRTIYLSGLHAPKAADGAAEVKEIFDEVKRLCDKTGSDLRHLVKATYHVATDDASKKLNELRPQYYDPKRPPSASKAMIAGTGRAGKGLTLDLIAVPASGPDKPEYGPPEQGHGLSPQDAAEGWLSLFDGQSTFGWSDARFDQGTLQGGQTTIAFGPCALRAEFATAGTLTIGKKAIAVKPGPFQLASTEVFAPLRLGDSLAIKRLAVKPLGLSTLLDGKDLSRWKRIDRPTIPEERRPTWKLSDGALQAVGGPGAMEYQGGSFADFVLQIEVRTHVRQANGGLFIRSMPGDFMNGYEAQLYNRAESGDPARPARYSTGAIDDRQLARRLVSRDRVPFVMTVIAQGPHLATWVNGYAMTDWVDTRPADPNPRRGLRTEPGTIQLQAHDPGTNLEFRRVQLAEWK